MKPDFSKYSKASSEVRAVFQDYDPDLDAASLDEAYMDVTEYCRAHEKSGKTLKICQYSSDPEGSFLIYLRNCQEAIQSKNQRFSVLPDGCMSTLSHLTFGKLLQRSSFRGSHLCKKVKTKVCLRIFNLRRRGSGCRDQGQSAC